MVCAVEKKRRASRGGGGRRRNQGSSDEGTENRQDPKGGRRDERKRERQGIRGVRKGEFCGTSGQASWWDGKEEEEGSRENRLPVPGLGTPS